MQMEHSEYIKLQNQLQDHFDGRYRKIDDCNETVESERKKIEKDLEKYCALDTLAVVKIMKKLYEV